MPNDQILKMVYQETNRPRYCLTINECEGDLLVEKGSQNRSLLFQEKNKKNTKLLEVGPEEGRDNEDIGEHN